MNVSQEEEERDLEAEESSYTYEDSNQSDDANEDVLDQDLENEFEKLNVQNKGNGLEYFYSFFVCQ